MSTKLLIHDLILSVKLGVSVAERSYPQEISVSIELCYSELPVACQSDNIIDTVCYMQLTEALQNYCHDKEFKLIEHLAWQLQQQTMLLVKDCIVKLRIKKMPVGLAAQHVEFSL